MNFCTPDLSTFHCVWLIESDLWENSHRRILSLLTLINTTTHKQQQKTYTKCLMISTHHMIAALQCTKSFHEMGSLILTGITWPAPLMYSFYGQWPEAQRLSLFKISYTHLAARSPVRNRNELLWGQGACVLSLHLNSQHNTKHATGMRNEWVGEEIN